MAPFRKDFYPVSPYKEPIPDERLKYYVQGYNKILTRNNLLNLVHGLIEDDLLYSNPIGINNPNMPHAAQTYLIF